MFANIFSKAQVQLDLMLLSFEHARLHSIYNLYTFSSHIEDEHSSFYARLKNLSGTRPVQKNVDSQQKTIKENFETCTVSFAIDMESSSTSKMQLFWQPQWMHYLLTEKRCQKFWSWNKQSFESSTVLIATPNFH